MLCTGLARRGVLAVIAALILLTGPVLAEDGAITLRLDGAPQPAQTQEASPPDAQPAPLVIPPTIPKLAPAPTVEAASAVLMDPETGQVIYSKNPHKRLQNASTTKIMTAILLIENCGMTDKITASKNAAQTQYTSLHLQPGEQINAKDLLFGMLIRSANDAAVAAAEHISGSVDKFAKLMNAKAKEIGCTDTHFVTPNGLYAKDHYSSAYDLALMAKYALKYPIFAEAVNTRKYELSSRTKNKKDMVVFSHHMYMRKYPYADGIKSGYIKQARYCYVGSATKNGWRLISAVLRSEHSADDTIALMNYGFDNFQKVAVVQAGRPVTHAEVTGGAAPAVAVAPLKDIAVVVPRTGAKVVTKLEIKDNVEAPVAKGAQLGTIAAMLDGREITKTQLRAVEPVQISVLGSIWSWMRSWGVVILCLMVGGKYGTALAKNPRRRRRRVTTAFRGYDRYR